MDPLTADETSHSRVVNVAGHAHHRAPSIDYDEVMFTRQNYRPKSFYAHSKLANIMFSRELARRLGELSIVHTWRSMLPHERPLSHGGGHSLCETSRRLGPRYVEFFMGQCSTRLT